MDKKSRELVMGKLYLKNRDYPMAEKSLLEYLKSSPDDFQALKLLAQVYEQTRDYLKAYELFERCYLAEPDRKGVVLDICRLLLIHGTSLEHVDRKKWCNLAQQSFPSNPIVTSLRDSLPQITRDNVASKMPLEEKIFSTLERLEQRLEQIESKLADLSLDRQKKDIVVSTTVQTPAPVHIPTPAPALEHVSTPEPARVPVSIPGPTQTPAPSLFSMLAPAQTPAPALTPAPTSSPNPLSKHNSTAPVSKSSAVPVSPPAPAPTPAPTSAPTHTSTFALSTSSAPTLSFAQPTTASPSSQTSSFLQPSQFSSFAPSSFASLALSSAANSQPTTFGSTTLSFGSFTTPSKPPPSNPFSFSGTIAGANSTPPTGDKSPAQTRDLRNDEDGDDDGGEEDVVKTEELPIENTCDMQPIEIKSGEEDEDIVFHHRCKLFRFRDKEYKERGLGEIKVLKHRTNGNSRLIMRREFVNLVCLNCWSCMNIERVKDNQVRFAGLDASDGEPEMTVFLVRFKTEEMTNTFENHLKTLFSEES